MAILLRAVRLLALVVWVGGIVFFAFVVAPVAFHNLPTPHEAGMVVRNTLLVLNVLGLVCGAVFLAATGLGWMRRRPKRSAVAQLVLVVAMLALTQYIRAVVDRMESDRIQAGGDIDAVPPGNPARLDFERLHPRSEKVEGAILFLGLAMCVLFAAESTEQSA